MMNRQLLFNLREDLKTNIDITIDKIIDNILNQKSTIEKELKYILHLLNEAKVDLENNRYFDLDDCTKTIVKIDYELTQNKLFEDISMVIQKADLYHKTIVQEFVKTQFTKVVYRFEKSTFILRICYQSDLLKEFVNYVLNNNSFPKDEEPVVVRGITAKEMLALDGDILSVYKKMMEYRKTWI